VRRKRSASPQRPLQDARRWYSRRVFQQSSCDQEPQRQPLAARGVQLSGARSPDCPDGPDLRSRPIPGRIWHGGCSLRFSQAQSAAALRVVAEVESGAETVRSVFSSRC